MKNDLFLALLEARRWIGDGEFSDGLHRDHWTPEYKAMVDMVDNTLNNNLATLSAVAEPEVSAVAAHLGHGFPVLECTEWGLQNLGKGDKLITLQSHREATKELWAKWANECDLTTDLYGAIAKKDTALSACVEVMSAAKNNNHTVPDSEEFDAAIEQAKEAVAFIGKMDLESLKTRGRVTATLYNEPVGNGSNEVCLFTRPQPAQVHHWQPIETAPKDGTNVLLINWKGKIASGLWLDGALGSGWFLRGTNAPSVFFNGHHGPTHWMPLPAAPGAAQPAQVPLTEEQRQWIVATCCTAAHIIDAVEGAHGIKGKA